MHLMAGGTEHYEIGKVVVASVAIEVGYFRDRRNPEAAMSASRTIAFERELPIVDPRHLSSLPFASAVAGIGMPALQRNLRDHIS